MHFDFSEEQRLLAQTVRDFLTVECTPEWIREFWAQDAPASRAMWSQLADLGLPGLLVSEAQGGLGLDEIDAVLVLEEVGRAALPSPVIATGAVTVPLLRDLGGELAEAWLPRIARGEAIAVVGHPVSPFVVDADAADLLLLLEDEAWRAATQEQVTLTRQPANDPSRRLFSVAPGAGEIVCDGARAHELAAATLDRGALACAAQALGVADRLIEMAVLYATQRHQFGVPIGSFQAIKHMLANVKVELEYARPAVYRAAHSVATDADTRAADVSMAAVMACEAARHAARTALQVHGAIGYTWEQDLHIWMRRAWSLERAWGDGAFHRDRLAAAVIDGRLPAVPFGYQPPVHD